jgi:Mitotic checkpoint regulator, MAD2B-interacting
MYNLLFCQILFDKLEQIYTMGLVDYSDSESDLDTKSTPSASASTVKTSSKPGFQRVVDRSNPRKIFVNLPKPTEDTGTTDGEHVSKRPRVGGGGLSGLNAMLPAPKRAQAAANAGGLNKGRALGIGSLKTGATPGFSREPMEEASYFKDTEDLGPGNQDYTDDGKTTNLFAETASTSELGKTVEVKKPAALFKPLSVARKTKRKVNLPTITNLESSNGLASPNAVSQIKSAPKVSLFSMGADTAPSSRPPAVSSSAYKPLLFTTPKESSEYPAEESLTVPSYEESSEAAASSSTFSPPSNDYGSQSLDSIASDLNLSASARRQLLGRGQRSSGASSVTIKNFNTDQEYDHNEELRAQGEQVMHNPVRALAPGKHSLQQLVNAAASQKDALEEQFAKGKRNKKEAGSKYGW